MRKLTGFGLSKRQVALTTEQEGWVKQMFDLLLDYNPSKVIGRDHIFEKEIKDMAAYFLLWAPSSAYAAEKGYTLPMIQEVFLSQLLFSSLLMGKAVMDGFVEWAATPITNDPTVDSGGLGVNKTQVDAAMAVAQKEVPTKPPEFVSDAPKSVQESGAKMVETWKLFKISVGFVSSNESGLRHYSLRFTKPPTSTFDQIENKLQDVLSHGGFHPEVPVVFTRLPFGEFEVHVPKDRDKWQAVSFMQYLWQAIDYQPRQNDRQMIDHFVAAICDHYHPRATLRKAPEVPIGVDIYGASALVHFAMGGLVVGASRMGKTTSMKLVVILLILMFPPSMLRLSIIDLKDVAFSRFTRNWRNPWMIGDVITTKNASHLESLFAALKKEERSRASRLARFDCENWLEYNEKNPFEPMAFSPLFVDEISMLKKFMGKERAEYWVEEITSLWSYVGMPLIAGTQYAVAQSGLPPLVRNNLETKIAFKADESCAENAFSNTHDIKAIANLLGGGDFIAKSPGMLLSVHGQGFDAPGKIINQVLEALRNQFSEASEDSYLVFADDIEDPWGEDGRPDCPKCESVTTKDGLREGKQRYKCSNKECGYVFVA